MASRQGNGGRLPGLDGVRAVAVALVMAYHGGVAGLSTAGFFGVDVFFVLSGFLITRMLLADCEGAGRVRFGRFWSRRAKRLLPGLLLMLLGVEAYVAWVAPAGRYPDFRADALSVVAYVSNWHFIHSASNYFAATGWPSLLTHTWSLAIEEQFYLVWPVAVAAAAWLARRLGRHPAAAVLVVSAVGAVASAAWMAFLFRRGAAASRLYYGTDTHAQSVLVGCALGAAFCLWPLEWRHHRWASPPVAVAALAGIGAAACSLGYADPITYQGGFLAVSLLSALLIAVLVTDPGGYAARALSVRPVAYLGRISYGMYLWYFPLFAVIDRAATGLSGPALLAGRVAAVVAVASVSFHLVEQPLRRWSPRPRPALASPGIVLGSAVAAATAVVGLVLVGTPAAYPAASPPAAGPAGTGGRGLKVLVFGDSTAVTLGDDLVFSPAAEQGELDLDVAGILGCGLVISWSVDPHGQPTQPNRPCWSATPADQQWPAILAADVAAFRPAVVLVVSGRWEVTSRQAVAGGPWLNITEPADRSYVQSQLERAAAIVSGGGADLAVATAPCFASGEQPDGQPWPEDSPARQGAYNSIVRAVVAAQSAANPGSAEVVDLASMVCPGGAFHTDLDGVTVRAPDGVHFPYLDIAAPDTPDPDTLAEVRAFASWIAPQILSVIDTGGK